MNFRIQAYYNFCYGVFGQKRKIAARRHTEILLPYCSYEMLSGERWNSNFKSWLHCRCMQSVPWIHGHRRTLLFGKIQKNVKREKLLQIMCFQSQVFKFFTWDELLQCYTLYIINSKTYIDVATFIWQWKVDVFPEFLVVPVSPPLPPPPHSRKTSPFPCHVNMAT
jgi:hypothetical protein